MSSASDGLLQHRDGGIRHRKLFLLDVYVYDKKQVPAGIPTIPTFMSQGLKGGKRGRAEAVLVRSYVVKMTSVQASW